MELQKWLKAAEDKGEFAIDTETNSLDAHQAKLVGISISHTIGKGCYIPTGHKNFKNLDETKILKICYVGPSAKKKTSNRYYLRSPPPTTLKIYK